MKSKIILATLALFILFSCKKKSEDVPTKKDYLTKSSWKRIKFVINNIDQDLNNPPYECSKDDFITFKSDNTFIIDKGLIKCSANEARYETGTWSFGNNETTLEQAFNTFNTSVDIEVLNDNNFIYSYSSGLKRITYSH